MGQYVNLPLTINQTIRMFTDRYDAGQQLAQQLASYTGTDTIVCAVPRGGVLTSMYVAQDLHLPLELMVVQHMQDPVDAHQSVGVVTETGEYVCTDQALQQRFGVLHEIVQTDKQAALAKRAAYTNNTPRCSFRDRHIIIVDDGIVTGVTMKAVIKAVQKDGAKKITVAVPIASHTIVKWLQQHVAEVVVLVTEPESIHALRPYYKHFPEVFDKEVMVVWNHERKIQPDAVCWPEKSNAKEIV